MTSSGNTGTRRITNTGVLPDDYTIFTGYTYMYPAWATNCNPGTGCTCELTINDDGSVTYTTGAQSGYTVTSGSGTYAPQCSSNAYTITYNLNGGDALPSGYTRLEYLQSTGSQYITTDFTPSTDFSTTA